MHLLEKSRKYFIVNNNYSGLKLKLYISIYLIESAKIRIFKSSYIKYLKFFINYKLWVLLLLNLIIKIWIYSNLEVYNIYIISRASSSRSLSSGSTLVTNGEETQDFLIKNKMQDKKIDIQKLIYKAK